jgi:hypothetical protein
MPIPFVLQWVVEMMRGERSNEPSRLGPLLEALGVTGDEAEREWAAVLEHKWYLSERVGRDVGVRTALVDYFENVRPPHSVAGMRAIEAARAALAAAAEPVLGVERVLGDFVDTVRGPRTSGR